MRPEQKTKSRAKLYQAMEGAKVIAGAAGATTTWTILFPNLAAATDTYIIGGYYFQFVADGSEDTPGDSAGTAADPHLVTIGGTPTATTAAANLVTALLAETTTTGAWGFLYPVDSVGASSSTGTVTINFWPGTAANAATYITESSSVGTDATITKTATGVSAPTLSADYNVNLIDTTGSAANKEYYHMVDGTSEGQICKVALKSAGGSDTPAIIGKMSDTSGADDVEALFTTAETGMYASFMWIASEWHLLEEGFGTALTIIDSAGS